jgi:CRISPR-associated endonuclease Csn1
MNKTIGLDLGTNSIGISVRDTDNGSDIIDQLEYFSSVIFRSGVGNGKSGEFSYAAERTKKRSTRRLYMARKYRIWATLKLLIENGYCPLNMENLEKWSKYDKAKGLKRKYPVEAEKFEQWVRLDFDGDGIADYSSPFQLRAELMERQFDFTQEIERYKLGRALYHIAQRRGFKSSKGETIKEQEKNESVESDPPDIVEAMKKSEIKKSGVLTKYMDEHNLKTVGCAYYALEKSGVRVRNSEYQAVRTQYKEEIELIFGFQDGLDQKSEFYKRLVSEKKGEGTIFYKRPLRSQKGLVGKCTLEPNKSRCPISHPEFERFRAWCLINNIRFGEDLRETLTINQKKRLYDESFLLTRSSFKFEDIRKWLEYETGKHFDYKLKTINYKDNANVSGCPVSARLRKLIGDDWETWEYKSGETKSDKKTGEVKNITYTAYDLWHVCFSFDEPDFVEEFAQTKLGFDKDKTKQLMRIYGSIQQGYGMLSLKAVRNINRFLEKGLIYSDAVLLAKLPDIFKDRWADVEDEIISELDKLIIENREQKQLLCMVNSLIANYKSLDFEVQFAYRNPDYKLDKSDYNDIKKAAVDAIGEKTWLKRTDEEKETIINQVAELYQSFFASSKRDYYKLPKVSESLAAFLKEKYHYLDEKDLRKIYHPSMIEFYAPSKPEKIEDGRCLRLLGSPVIGALKNPMAMRVLHTLRKQVNALLKATDKDGNALIDEDTRVVVETARELNDANMRWAIEAYQREREKENKEYEKILKEYFPDRIINDDDIDEVRLLCDQHEIAEVESESKKGKNQKEDTKDLYFKKDVTKYRLWLEQGCRCLYTGKMINISNLFDDNVFDIEHTIPRSLSFDDSMANLTICDAHYNRAIKKNQIPTQLANYENDANGYTAIKPRLQPWIEKVEQLKDNVAYWKAQSRKAQDKDSKDKCIRQRHLWQMELDYWQNKVDRFMMTEVTSGFRNSQLVDTRIITKYAYHYLKTVFNKVEVQKGSVTSSFRKILGVQSVDEKKSRDKHSHHAIDATVLTLVPTAAKRDKMLELFYKIQEKEKLNEETAYLEKELKKEINSCGLGGNISEIVPFIENNILVNHVSKDQTLVPSHRRKRIRGKVVWKTDEKGLKVYDEEGNPVPKEWLTGDSIRGQLHKDSFFGAIKYPKINGEGLPIKENEHFVFENDGEGNPIITMVIREDIKEFKKESDISKIIDPYVRETIETTIKKRKAEGVSFDKAINEPMWLLDKNGNEIKYDKNGRLLSPIRHVRCRVAAGRGFFTKDKAIRVKAQTYPSKYDYKNLYYAQNDGNYLCLLYEGVKKGKIERKFRFLNYFEVASMSIKDVKDLMREPYFNKIEEKNFTLNLTAIIKAGTRVLMWTESPEELTCLSDRELSRRLFIVYKFNLKGANCIYLQNHIEARNEISKDEDFTVYDSENYQARLTLVANGFNCLIEDRDFVFDETGKIELL